MKAFKSSSFSLHNRQPLTFYLLIQGLFRATLCALQQLNSFFPNYSQSPVCPALCSTLFGSPCSNFPTHSSQGCHQKQDSRTAVCLLTKKRNRECQIGEEEWTWVFCGFMHFVERYSADTDPLSNFKLPPSVCSFMPPPTHQIFSPDMIF